MTTIEIVLLLLLLLLLINILIVTPIAYAQKGSGTVGIDDSTGRGVGVLERVDAYPSIDFASPNLSQLDLHCKKRSVFKGQGELGGNFIKGSYFLSF